MLEFKKDLKRKLLRLHKKKEGAQSSNVRIAVISVHLIQPILCKHLNTDFSYLTKKVKVMLLQETEIQ